MIKGIACILAAALFAAPALADPVCATPGRDGAVVGVTGVVNTYFAGTTGSLAAGAKTISLGASAGAATAISTGDLLLVIQMQDAEINTADSSDYGDGPGGNLAAGVSAMNQTGLYEYVRAGSNVPTSGGTLTLVGAAANGGLVNSYVNADATISKGQRRYQVIRVPQYSNLSLGVGLTAYAWDGTRGGVLAVDVAGRLDLNSGSATVSGQGFRGGGGRKLLGAGLGFSSSNYLTTALVGANGSKGEGIVGTPAYVSAAGNLLSTILSWVFDVLPGGSYGRGAPGNAGGGATDGNPFSNNNNAGGGGGASYGSGGKGGNANCGTAPTGCASSGGYGGAGVTVQTAARVVLGGGGGAGSSDGGSGLLGDGFGSSGAAGGGLVLIRAGVVAGAGSIYADGAAASNSVTTDGSGGGGGGGGVLLYGRELEAGAALAAYARGGAGGTNSGGGSAHGPGGGGGGGLIMTSLAATTAITGGANGVTAGSIAYGSTSGASGLASTNLGVGLSLTGVLSGDECAPILEKVFDVAKIAIGAKARLTLRVKNNSVSGSLSGVAFIDTYPSGMINAPVPNLSTNCGGTVTAVAGTNNLTVIGAGVAAAAYCTISVDVVTQNAGNYLNKVNAGGLAATLVSQAVTSIFDASAPIETIQPLTVTKSVATLSDPKGSLNPKAIPGALLQYSITVTNPSTSSVSGVSLADAIPTRGKIVVTDIGAAGSGPISFTQGTLSSTLAYTFTSLASATDSIDFSCDNGATWTCTPTPDADGASASVTNIRVHPTGSHAALGSFTLAFRIRVK